MWYAETPAGYNGLGDVYPGGGNGEATVLLTKYNGYSYICRIGGDNTFCDICGYMDGSEGITFIGGASSKSKLNKFSKWPWPQYSQYLPESTKDPTEVDVAGLQPVGQTVPVQYIRSDGEVLEDSFTIEVLPDPDGAHPQVDPSTVEWNHRRYKANEDLGAVEVRHGSVYMEGGAIYDVGAAVRLGMLEPVDNEIVP
jgi:hypothetical protein